MNKELEHPGQRNEYWGGFATLGFGILIAIIFMVIQMITLGVLVGNELLVDPSVDIEGLVGNLENDGFCISIFSCVSTLFCLPLILLIVKVKQGASVKDYLGIKLTSKKELGFWLAIIVGFMILADVVYFIIGRPVVPEFMSVAYETATIKPLFWVALVLSAPLLEETFFRGFLLQGFKTTFFGPLGAILITSICWTVIHIQYELVELSLIFIMGVIFGYARLKTGSLLICIVLHALVNFVATVETAITVTSSVA